MMHDIGNIWKCYYEIDIWEGKTIIQSNVDWFGHSIPIVNRRTTLIEWFVFQVTLNQVVLWVHV